MRLRFCLPVLACLVSQVGPSAADQPPIVLDIHATQDGHAVTDLVASELSLSEGGVPQTIERIRHAGSDRRSFVVFLDTAHMRFEGARGVRIPLGRLLERIVDGGDLVGVMTPDVAPRDIQFGARDAVISGALQDEALWERARVGWRDPKEDRYAQCFPANQYRDVARDLQERHREKVTFDALEALTSFLAGREDRVAVVLVTDGWQLFGPGSRIGSGTPANGGPRGGFGGGSGSGGTGGRGGGGGRGGRGGFPGGRGGARGGSAPSDGEAGDSEVADADAVSRVECDADRISLASMNDAVRLDRIEDGANRAMASFYALLARGLVAEQTPTGRIPAGLEGEERDPASRLDAMRQLSDNTDGMVGATAAALDGVVARIRTDMREYDVVSYRSANASLDGKFRSITVRGQRPGMTIRTRRGYRGASVEDVLGPTGPAARAADSAFASLAASSPRASFRMRTTAAMTTDMSAATLWIVGELDYRVRRELAWTSGAVADVVVVAADGREITSQSVEVPAEAASFTIRATPDGSGLAPGDYAVRVRLRPNNDGALPVSDTARVVVPRHMATLGEGLLWRRGGSTGPRFQVTADARFPRSDRIRVELPTQSASTATARMLDRRGSPNQIPVQVTSRPDETNQFRWVVAEAALAALAPGDYAIETTLDGVKQVTAFELVP